MVEIERFAYPNKISLLARTDVKIILAHEHTACRVRTLLHLAISVIQKLAVDAAPIVNERIKSDVLQ